MRAPSICRLSLTPGTEPERVDESGTRDDREPAERELRTEHARDPRVDRPTLPELLVPGVLERVREAVREHQREVPAEDSRDGDARECERGEHEQHPADAVVEAEMDRSECRIPRGGRL